MALWGAQQPRIITLHGRGSDSQKIRAENTQDLTAQTQSKKWHKLTWQHLAKVLIMPISLDGKVATLTETVRKIFIINFVLLNKIIAG